MLGCDVWADMKTGEGKIISVCAKVYEDQIEFFYKTKGCEELTEREWQEAEERVLHG